MRKLRAVLLKAIDKVDLLWDETPAGVVIPIGCINKIEATQVKSLLRCYNKNLKVTSRGKIVYVQKT